MKKAWIIILFVSLAVLCPAPINQQPPDGYQPLPARRSDPELTEEQKNQTNIPVVGHVDMTNDKHGVDAKDTSPEANDTLKAASEKQGSAVVSKATKDLMGTGTKPSFPWMWALLVLAFGFGVVFVAKQWADKHIPDPTAKNKKLTW